MKIIGTKIKNLYFTKFNNSKNLVYDEYDYMWKISPYRSLMTYIVDFVIYILISKQGEKASNILKLYFNLNRLRFADPK